MKLLLITNILSPYRKYLYDLLNEEIIKNGGEFKVLVMAETEYNRPWIYEDFKENYTSKLKGKTFNFKFKSRRLFLHFNIGLIKEIEDFNPDILILSGAWIFPTTVVAALYNKYFKKNKCAMLFWSESHLNEQREYSSIIILIRNYLREKFYGMFDAFLSPGKLANEFIYKACRDSNKKIFFLPNIVDNKFFEEAYYLKKTQKSIIKKGMGISESEFVFICPARLTEEKGLLEFIENCRAVITQKQYRIIIAGTGHLERKIKDLKKKYELNIDLVGQKTLDELKSLYAIADVFLLPSLSDPNPLSVIEASWAGLPLLVSQYVGNYPELITGDNGFIFDTLNKDSVEGVIKDLYDKDNEWVEKAGRSSSENVKNKFYANTVVKELIEALKAMYLGSN